MWFLPKIHWGKLDLSLGFISQSPFTVPLTEVLPSVQSHSCRKCLILGLSEEATLYLLTSSYPSILETHSYRYDFPNKRHEGKGCTRLWWGIKRIKNYSFSLSGGMGERNPVVPVLPLKKSKYLPIIPDLFARWIA